MIVVVFAGIILAVVPAAATTLTTSVLRFPLYPLIIFSLLFLQLASSTITTTSTTSLKQCGAQSKHWNIGKAVLASIPQQKTRQGRAKHHLPRHKSIVTEFVERKCGIRHFTTNDDVPKRPSIWVYNGYLIDPITGTEICNVEGIELIQSIGHTTTPTTAEDTGITDNSHFGSNDAQLLPWVRYRRRCRNLQIINALQQHNDGSNATSNSAIQSCTLLSRKCFCYTTRDGTQLLSTIRKRPQGPITHVPFHQAISWYDSVLSCIATSPSSSSSKLSTTRSNTQHDTTIAATAPSWWLHTEWPMGKVVWSRVTNSLQQPSSSALTMNMNPIQKNDIPWEFSIFTRRQQQPLLLFNKCKSNLEQQQLKQNSSTQQNNRTETMQRPNRLSLIQLGGGSSKNVRQSGSDFGVRETYQYLSSSSAEPSDSNNDVVVRYTRYGEAPVWYGPGRMCQLELTGTRIETPSPRRVFSSMTLKRNNADHDDDNDETRLTIKAVTNYVPIAADVINRNAPHFWKFGILNQNLPMWQQSLRSVAANPKIATNRKNDETIFQHYSAALHPVLQMDTDDELLHTNKRDEKYPALLTGAEYQRFYTDLAMGRRMGQFVQEQWPQQKHQQLQSMNRHILQQPGLRKILSALSSGWDKIRTATSLSIGSSGDH
jgi:hypothetical protein